MHGPRQNRVEYAYAYPCAHIIQKKHVIKDRYPRTQLLPIAVTKAHRLEVSYKRNTQIEFARGNQQLQRMPNHVHERELRKLSAANTSNLFVFVRLVLLLGFRRYVDFVVSRRRPKLRSGVTRLVATGSTGLTQFVLSLFWSGDKSLSLRWATV